MGATVKDERIGALYLVRRLKAREGVIIPARHSGKRGIQELLTRTGNFHDDEKKRYVMDSPEDNPRAYKLIFNYRGCEYDISVPKRLREGEQYAEMEIRRVR